jgi:hypothetical protein
MAETFESVAEDAKCIIWEMRREADRQGNSVAEKSEARRLRYRATRLESTVRNLGAMIAQAAVAS